MSDGAEKLSLKQRMELRNAQAERLRAEEVMAAPPEPVVEEAEEAARPSMEVASALDIPPPAPGTVTATAAPVPQAEAAPGFPPATNVFPIRGAADGEVPDAPPLHLTMMTDIVDGPSAQQNDAGAPEGPKPIGAHDTVPDQVDEPPASPEEQARLDREREEQLRLEAEARAAAGLPPLPPDAPEAVQKIGRIFSSMAVGVVQANAHGLNAINAGIADRTRRMQEAQQHERAMAEAKRTPGAMGGGRGLPIPTFGRQSPSRALERELSSLTKKSEQQQKSGTMAERIALQHVAGARSSSIKLYSGIEALKESMTTLNNKLDATPEAQSFLADVDKYGKTKGLSRDQVFETLRQPPGGLTGLAGADPAAAALRGQANELARNPELAPLFEQADQLAGEVKQNARGMAKSLSALRRSGHDVSSAEETLNLLDAKVPSSKVPNLNGNGAKLEKMSEEMQEQMRKIAEAITSMINRMVEKVRSVFGR